MLRQIWRPLQVLSFTFWIAQGAAGAAQARLQELPQALSRAAMIRQMASEMERLDGEALYVRQNRPLPWSTQVLALEQEALAATSWESFARVFAKLNQAYPNLHSNLDFAPTLSKVLPVPISSSPELRAEWRTPHSVTYVVSGGDEVLAINGIAIDQWQTRHFEFCKFPLKAQCDFYFLEDFFKETQGWDRSQKLELTLARGEAVWTQVVQVKPSLPPPREQNLECKNNLDRYAGFRQTYTGKYLCIYESPGHPGAAIVRISSFHYGESRRVREKIQSVTDEVAQIYPWWAEHATWDHLLIDVIDNHGGNAPIDYYQILLQSPFQEQFVTFKKIKEMNDDQMRASIFWGSPGLEIWFQNLKKKGLWELLPWGDFTPQVPMFCADDQQDCSFGQFPVQEHSFRGRISLLLNQWCVSSCDGFVGQIAEKFGAGARLFGQPQAADTGYSRLVINLTMDPASPFGFDLKTAGLDEPPSTKTLLSQSVVVTRSRTESGEVPSGHPLELTEFVPRTLRNSDNWHQHVLERALAPR